MIESFKLPNITSEVITGSICSFNDEYGGLPLKSCTSLISGYQEGSGIPSPDNVRNLVSFSSASLTATGKNLFDKSKNIGKYLDGSLTIRTNAEFKSVYVELKPNTTYTYSQTESGNYKRYALANSLEEYAEFVNPVDHSSHLYLSETPFTFNSGDYKYLICTIYRVSDTKTFDEIANSCQLEIGQEATAYEPFGNTYTFTFGQSIYQGSIDWKRGVVKSNYAIEEFDGSSDESWSSAGTIGSNYRFVLSGFTTNYKDSSNSKSNYLRYNTSTSNYFGYFAFVSSNFIVCDSQNSIGGLSAFKTYLSSNPLQLAYELATPIERPLGGINLLTQEGQNNIFCDTGDTEVKFLKVT